MRPRRRWSLHPQTAIIFALYLLAAGIIIYRTLLEPWFAR